MERTAPILNQILIETANQTPQAMNFLFADGDFLVPIDLAVHKQHAQGTDTQSKCLKSFRHICSIPDVGVAQDVSGETIITPILRCL